MRPKTVSFRCSCAGSGSLAGVGRSCGSPTQITRMTFRHPQARGLRHPPGNSVEEMNGFIKDGAHEAVDDPERRRIRGLAAQCILLAFQLFGANLRKGRGVPQEEGRQGQEGPEAAVPAPHEVPRCMGPDHVDGRRGHSRGRHRRPRPSLDCLTLSRPESSHLRGFIVPGGPPGSLAAAGIWMTTRRTRRRDPFRRDETPFDGWWARPEPGFCRHEPRGFVESPWWARGDLNPHILSDTGT
jgi:hypothetical protein